METQRKQPQPRPMRLAYLVSHPIQYQAPLLRRIAEQPDIDLTVFFGSDFSVRGYRDEGFGVDVSWDTPLLEGYRYVVLPALRDTGTVSPTTPISRGLYGQLLTADRLPAFDALWVHGYASINALQGILTARALGIPVLLRAESWLADRERSGLKLAAKRAFFRGLQSLVAAVLPIGTENARYWQHYFGDSVPQFPMPYAIDNAWFARCATEAAVQQPALRSALQLDPARRVILFASKLQERKHCRHLVEAYTRFAQTQTPGTAPYLVIVGDGEERAALEALCRDRDLRDVRFAGFQNQTELPGFFQLADVFVLPSRHEPWGLIVNEALAAGCPCIVSTDVGSHTDLIHPGENGYVFPTGDIAALTAALSLFFAEPEKSSTMRHKASASMTHWSFEEDIAGLRRALCHVTGRDVTGPGSTHLSF